MTNKQNITLPSGWAKIIQQRLSDKGYDVSLSTIHKTKLGIRKNYYVLKELRLLENEYINISIN